MGGLHRTGARARPDRAELVHFSGTEEIRDEISRVVPNYALIRTLKVEGDQFQYGGAMLCQDWRFPTPDGKARFSTVAVPERDIPDGAFMVTTRRGRQFNSMVQGDRDGHTGAGRGSVFISKRDALSLGITDGTPVILRSDHGELAGQAMLAPVTPRTLQVHWPEAEVLLDRTRRSPASGIPDYTAIVRIEVPGGP